MPFQPGVVRYTPELLPFWMTTVLMEVTYQVEMDPETINDRRTTRRSGIVSGVHKCSIGATICATEPGHWAQ
jgi:hypothetical protein